VSIPYNAVYATVSDITDEYSPSGNPLEKITDLRDDQLTESWLWDPDFSEWYGADFAIERGRGYEFNTIVDTTWDPTEYSNEAKSVLLAKKSKQSHSVVYTGTDTDLDRAPTWLIDGNPNAITIDDRSVGIYKPNPAALGSTGQKDKVRTSLNKTYTGAVKGTGAQREKISHVVRVHVMDAQGYERMTFTMYRLNSTADALTEKMIGSTMVKGENLWALWCDAGNFKRAWLNGEETILIIEATKQGKPYSHIENFTLDEKVDIQDLGKMKLEPLPMAPGPQGQPARLCWSKLGNDNIIGYSLYKHDQRVNGTILQGDYLLPSDMSVRIVIRGGYETVYSSQGIQSQPLTYTPVSYAFAIIPNPFVRQARIDYALPKQTSVDIKIFDISGRQVKILNSGIQHPGYYSVVWNGSDDNGRKIASGVYFVRFEAGEFRAQDKILMVR